MCEGEALTRICEESHLPSVGTFMRHIYDTQELREEYELALRIRADTWADQVVSLADAATPADAQVARLRVDTRKWVAARLIPHRYGDRQAIEVSGPEGGPITFADLARKAKADA
jgi:hypothetical protein